MKREKFCHVVRVIIALPVMLWLLVAMMNAFTSYGKMGLIAMGMPYSQLGLADLLSLVLICFLAKPLYLRLYQVLHFLIR